jgi:transposase
LRWRDELHLLGNDAFPDQERTRDEDLVSLKRELAQVKKERDFLKEAAAYFAEESK